MLRTGHYHMKFLLYAADITRVAACRRANSTELIYRCGCVCVCVCVEVVASRMTANRLPLNATITELL